MLTLFVLALGVVATGLGAWREFRTAERLDQVRFRELTETVRGEIVQRMHTYQYGLQSLRCLYQSSEVVTNDEFDSAAQLWTSAKDFPGVLGIGFIEQVPQELRDPSNDRGADRMIVRSFYAPDGNGAWAGRSIGDLPHVRQAAELAAKTGEAELSEQMDIATRGETVKGFLSLLPVYSSASENDAPTYNIDSLRGWIGMVLVANKVFADIPASISDDVNFRLYDGPPLAQNHLFGSTAHVHSLDGPYCVTAPLQVGGREWTVIVNATDSFDYASRDLAWALFAAGCIVTLLIAYLLHGQSLALQQAKALSEGMTEEIRRLAMVAERTTNGVLITDEQHRVLWANEGFRRLCGYQLEEVRGMVPGDFLRSPNTNTQAVAMIQQAVIGGEAFHGEVLSRRKNGEEFWVDLEIQPRYDDTGQLNGFIAIQSDITDRVIAERRARALAEILQEAPDEIYLIDTETLCLVQANSGCSKQLGYSRENLIGMHIWQFQPDSAEETFRAKCEPLDNGSLDKLVFDTTHRRRDGSIYQVNVNLHRSRFEGREVYVAFVADLTDRMKLEQQLAQAQKLESIGQLAAGVAHEINTPMQCVVSNVEYLSEVCVNLFEVTDGYRDSLRRPAMSWEERKEALERLEVEYNYPTLRQDTLEAIVESAEAANRVVEVVRAMKTMAHPGSSEKTWIDLNEMIRSAVMVSRNRWKYCASLEMALDESLPCIPLLSNHMNQVLLNLLVNAADAITDQIEKQMNDELGTIEVATWWESEGVMLRIRDTGCGMTPQVKRRAFDPFFTTKEVGKGTGQGLAICYDVVVLKHAGRIHIESEVGQGTSITVWLPGRHDDEEEQTCDISALVPQPGAV